MIYRFSARQPSSQKTIEVQLQVPVGTPLDKLTLALRRSFSQQGIELDSLEYVGSIDTDSQGVVVPAEEMDAPSVLSEEGMTARIHGWYSPIGNAQANNQCVVDGCGRESSFHLCNQHEIPGMVVEINGDRFVISSWLVERAGQRRVITLNDYALGDLFGGREAFEDRLGVQGYKLHGLISGKEELEGTRKLKFTLWSPDLPDGEDSQLNQR
jgi:hypothetical protein